MIIGIFFNQFFLISIYKYIHATSISVNKS